MADENARIEGLLQAMSLDEKLGQITMIRADFGDAGAELGRAKLEEIRAGRAGSILDLRGVDRILEAQRAAVEGSRLGIPLLVTLDVLHGYETIFPIPLGEAAAFDPNLWERTACAAAVESAAAGIALTYAPCSTSDAIPDGAGSPKAQAKTLGLPLASQKQKCEGFSKAIWLDPKPWPRRQSILPPTPP